MVVPVKVPLFCRVTVNPVEAGTLMVAPLVPLAGRLTSAPWMVTLVPLVNVMFPVVSMSESAWPHRFSRVKT